MKKSYRIAFLLVFLTSLINGSYTAIDIKAVFADESDVKIFTISGKELNNLQKGVNILRYKDGRTQKLIIK